MEEFYVIRFPGDSFVLMCKILIFMKLLLINELTNCNTLWYITWPRSIILASQCSTSKKDMGGNTFDGGSCSCWWGSPVSSYWSIDRKRRTLSWYEREIFGGGVVGSLNRFKCHQFHNATYQHTPVDHLTTIHHPGNRVFRDESNAPGFISLSYREVWALGPPYLAIFWCASQSEAIISKSRPLIGSRTEKWENLGAQEPKLPDKIES